MQSIVQHSHAAMMWLLGLGLISAWAAYDQPPPVLEKARGIVTASLTHAKYLGLEGDPLQGLSPAAYATLRQYRHEFIHEGLPYEPSLYREQLAGIEPVPAEFVLALGRRVQKQAEEAKEVPKYRDLVLSSLRSDLAALETWHTKSKLSPLASLGDVRQELGSKIQVPGTEQAITIQQCMTFVGIGLVAAHLYLTSLFATLATLPRDDEACDRGWIVLHKAPLGPLLTALWLGAPCLAWLFEHILLPLDRREPWPDLGTWLLAGTIAATMLAMLWQAQRVRRCHLPTGTELRPSQFSLPRAA